VTPTSDMTLSGTLSPIAIGSRFKKYPQIFTLGLRPNFEDYSRHHRQLIRSAPKIYYPTAFYVELFNTMGKQTFPSFHTYEFALDKIKQTAMFKLLKIPHPYTRVFYGKRQKKTISDFFKYPFVAKTPRGSSKGKDVFLIETPTQLSDYLAIKGPAYIQEYLPIDRDMRVVIVGKKIRLAYWRMADNHTFKTNLSQGGTICFDPLPQKALDLALSTAIACKWNDIGLDIIEHNNQFYVLEANVKYGTKGFKKAGINYKDMMVDLIINGKI
jgi:ribosomal protein S6--L-glutamate ligase